MGLNFDFIFKQRQMHKDALLYAFDKAGFFNLFMLPVYSSGMFQNLMSPI